jgi:hypothetical protein
MARSLAGLALGLPGVYQAPAPETRALQAVRMDVAGFVGVASRGPVDAPVPIDSWSDYQWHFGDDALGGAPAPGLLSEAVRVFFGQGGRRAWVLRVSPVPRLPSPDALAAHAALSLAWGPPEGVRLRASSEGSWGTKLVVEVDFQVNRFLSECHGRELPLPDGVRCAPGDLVRIARLAIGAPRELRWVETVIDIPDRRMRLALLDRAVASDGPVRVDVITAAFTVTDTSTDVPRQERFTDLKLHDAGQPRFALKVLAEESRLVTVDKPWPEEMSLAGPELATIRSALVPNTGADRWAGISGASFGDDTLDPGLLPVAGPEGLEGMAVYGADRLALEPEVMLLSAPDLLWDTVVVETTTAIGIVDAPQMETGACSPDPVGMDVRRPALGPLYLDPRTQLDEVLARQARLIALAERQRRFVALLDVPSGLSARGVARWRASFDSSYAAAYHPWLGVMNVPAGQRQAVAVPPSAFAAGIIAARERSVGIPWGPANVIAEEAVSATQTLDQDEADELDALDINLFRPERDGFRLVAARTLATDPDFHQLSVRRLLTMLRLVLERQTQWLAFEPHTDELRRQITVVVTHLLRDLFRAGAFAGETEQESFFVRCDETVNPAWSVDQGRLITQVGVAPSVPLEFIVLRLTREASGALTVEQ